jgi:hypothetical protein
MIHQKPNRASRIFKGHSQTASYSLTSTTKMGKANRKRKGGPFHDEPSERRHRGPPPYSEGGQSSTFPTAYAPLNQSTGMRAAFPGLDDYDNGEESFYGPANDGIDYLRMVR